jgi:hypothetical protein
MQHPMIAATSRSRSIESYGAYLRDVTSEDVQSASALLGLVVVYGLVMEFIGQAPREGLAKLLSDYAGLSFYSCLLVGCGYAAGCLAWPSLRRDAGRRLFWLVVACGLTSLIFPFFLTFKELVLPARGFLWDRSFAHMGRILFGTSPWTLTHHVFGNPIGARILDWSYRSWLPLMFGLPAVSAVLFADARLRLRILTSWTLCWILIGTVAAWYFASAGPCYFNIFIGSDPDYADLLRRLAAIGRRAAAEGHPIAVLQFQPGLVEIYRARALSSGGGISAMPSVHVAMASLFALVGFRINRWLGWAFVAFVMMVWTATVFFGWHYIVDGPVGVAMMLGIWTLAKVIAARAYPEKTVDAGETSDAALTLCISHSDEDDSDCEDWQAERAA